jgi:diaminopimelate epimerase
MGNPHAVFFVPDVAAVKAAEIGARLERHPLFPERANIGFAQILARDAIRLRVWERGAGLTLACGSGACAALVAAVRRGLVERKARLELDGGTLTIEWLANQHVLMSGPASLSFRGTMFPSLLNGSAAG